MSFSKLFIVAVLLGIGYYIFVYNSETVDKGVKIGVEEVTGKRQRDSLKDVKKQVGDIEKTMQKNLDEQLQDR